MARKVLDTPEVNGSPAANEDARYYENKVLDTPEVNGSPAANEDARYYE